MCCFWAWLSSFLNCSPSMDNAHLGTPGKTHSKPKPAPCFPSTQLLQNSSNREERYKSRRCDSAPGLCKQVFLRGSGASFQFFPKILKTVAICAFSLGIYRAGRCPDLLLVVALGGRFYFLAGIFGWFRSFLSHSSLWAPRASSATGLWTGT